VVRLRLLIETVLQKLFAVKLNLMSANLGVVFMRRPNRPHREPNEYDYQNYIWKDFDLPPIALPLIISDSRPVEAWA